MRRIVLAVALALVTAASVASPALAGSCDDERQPGYATHACKVQRLRARSFVVVAVVGNGINPYHADFRVPAGDDLAGVHPAEFIDGFPADAPTFDLALDAEHYGDAVASDHFEWQALQRDRLYTFPGTTVIGGWSTRWDLSLEDPVLEDDGGAGTAAASVAAGRGHGASGDAETLIVAVEGIHAEAVEWAASQPWIDVVVVPWNYQAGMPPTGEHRSSRAVAERGGIFVAAAGERASSVSGAGSCGNAPGVAGALGGPPWQVTVGGVSTATGQPACSHAVPVDVSSYGSDWPAASHRSIDDEVLADGTGNAASIVAGTLASVVLEARRALGDTGTRPRDGALAIASDGVALPTSGPLADGRLTAEEAQEVVFKTATVEPFEPGDMLADPATVPNTPAYFAYSGYGLVNESTKAHAIDVLHGRAPMPDRSDADAWAAARDAALSVWRHVP